MLNLCWSVNWRLNDNHIYIGIANVKVISTLIIIRRTYSGLSRHDLILRNNLVFLTHFFILDNSEFGNLDSVQDFFLGENLRFILFENFLLGFGFIGILREVDEHFYLFALLGEPSLLEILVGLHITEGEQTEDNDTDKGTQDSFVVTPG